MKNSLETHMYASQWFLTLFTAKFPLHVTYHIMDIYLCEVKHICIIFNSLCLSPSVSLCLSLSLSVSVSLCLSLCLSFSVSVSLCLSVSLSLSLSQGTCVIFQIALSLLKVRHVITVTVINYII